MASFKVITRVVSVRTYYVEAANADEAKSAYVGKQPGEQEELEEEIVEVMPEPG